MADFAPVFQAVIALMAILSFLLLGFNALLAPLRKNQGRMETRMDRMETRMDRLEQDVSGLKQDISVIKEAVLKT